MAALNFDILHHVVPWCAPETLLAVSLVSRAARRSACPWLYQDVVVDLNHPAHAENLLLILVNHPGFLLRTRSFRVVGHCDIDERSVPLQLIRLVLQLMPHLEVLDVARYLNFLASIDLDRLMLRALSNLPSLVEFHFRNSEHLNELISNLPPLRRMTIEHFEISDNETSALLESSRPVLTALEVNTGDISALTGAGSEPWSAVTVLSVQVLTLEMASAFPNIVHLRLMSIGVHLLSDASVLPLLQALYLSDHHMPLNNGTLRKVLHFSLESHWAGFRHMEHVIDGAALTSLHVHLPWPTTDAFVVFGQFLNRVAESYPNLRRLIITFITAGGRAYDRSGLLHALVGPRGRMHRSLRVLRVLSRKQFSYDAMEQLRLQRAVENTFPELTFAELMFGTIVTHWSWYRVLHRAHVFRRSLQVSSWSWVEDVDDPAMAPCEECRDFQKNALALNQNRG